MKRWIRPFLLTLALILGIVAVLSGVGFELFRSTPAWYAGRVIPPAAQQQQLAAAAEDKLIMAQNWAAELHADAVRAAHAAEIGAKSPSTRAANSNVIEFSQDELNALFAKWSVLYGWLDHYRQFVDDPAIILRDGRLIVAGNMQSLGTVVSVQFHPLIDDAGSLRLDLAEVDAGKLPLPDAVWTSQRKKLEAAVARRLPLLKQQARINASGAANSPALQAMTAELFFHVMRHEPADPVLFLPLADGADSMPVRIREIEVDDGKLLLSVVPLTAVERAALFDKIRSTSN